MKKICKNILLGAVFASVSGVTSGELNASNINLTAQHCPSAGHSTLYKALSDPGTGERDKTKYWDGSTMVVGKNGLHYYLLEVGKHSNRSVQPGDLLVKDPDGAGMRTTTPNHNPSLDRTKAKHICSYNLINQEGRRVSDFTLYGFKPNKPK